MGKSALTVKQMQDVAFGLLSRMELEGLFRRNAAEVVEWICGVLGLAMKYRTDINWQRLAQDCPLKQEALDLVMVLLSEGQREEDVRKVFDRAMQKMGWQELNG